MDTVKSALIEKRMNDYARIEAAINLIAKKQLITRTEYEELCKDSRDYCSFQTLIDNGIVRYNRRIAISGGIELVDNRATCYRTVTPIYRNEDGKLITKKDLEVICRVFGIDVANEFTCCGYGYTKPTTYKVEYILDAENSSKISALLRAFEAMLDRIQ